MNSTTFTCKSDQTTNCQRTDFNSSVISACKSWDFGSYEAYEGHRNRSIQEKVGGYIVKRKRVVNPVAIDQSFSYHIFSYPSNE